MRRGSLAPPPGAASEGAGRPRSFSVPVPRSPTVRRGGAVDEPARRSFVRRAMRHLNRAIRRGRRAASCSCGACRRRQVGVASRPHGLRSRGEPVSLSVCPRRLRPSPAWTRGRAAWGAGGRSAEIRARPGASLSGSDILSGHERERVHFVGPERWPGWAPGDA